MLAQPVGEEAAQRVQRKAGSARFQRHIGLGRLAAIGVGDADDDAFGDIGVLVDRLFDLRRIDVEAARQDHVLAAVHKREIAAIIHPAHVAGQEPAIGEGSGVLRRAVPVAGEDVGPADRDLAHLADGAFARRCVGVHDPHLDTRQGQADEARAAWRIGGDGGAGGAGLGHAPAAADAPADQRFQLPQRLERHGRAARAYDAEGSEALGPGLGAVQHADPHGRHAGEGVDAERLDLGDGLRGVEARAQMQQRAFGHLAQQHGGQREDVEQRQ